MRREAGQAEVEREILEGYLIDIACVRKYRRDELHDKARAHSRDCVLMGHCVESGYALLCSDGLALLDDSATPLVVATVRASKRDRGIAVRVERERHEGTMSTAAVSEIDPP